jgi:hypothetical protein
MVLYTYLLRIPASPRILRYDLGRRIPHFSDGSIIISTDNGVNSLLFLIQTLQLVVSKYELRQN